MRSTLQSVINSRSLALQQYDEAKKSASSTTPSGSSTNTTSKSRNAAPVTPQKTADDELCGWQDEPSVPAAARVASAKLVRHQTATSPVQPPSTQLGSSSNNSNVGSSSLRRTAAGIGSNSSSSPTKRTVQRPSVALRSTIAKQQKHPAVRVVQLGEEDSYGSSAEHYRPPVAPPQAVLAAEVPSKGTKDTISDAANTASSSSSTSSGKSCRPDSSGPSASPGTSLCVLPQLHPSNQQQQQDATSGCTALADISSLQPSSTLQQAGATAPASTLIASGSYGQPAEGAAWQCDDDFNSSLYAPRCSSRGGVGSLPLPSHTSSWILNSSSSLNSNILALQQRLLLHPPPYGSLGSGSSTMLAGSRPAAAAASLAGSCTQGSATTAATVAQPVSGRALLCSTGAASPQGTALGFCLHSRMATTAARAQLLLTRDLTSLVTPHTPRMRQLLSPAPSTSEGPAAEADSCSQQLQQQQQIGAGEGACFGVPARVQPVGPASTGSSLRFVSSSSKCGSRPSSAPRARLSTCDTAATGAGSYDHAQGGAAAGGMSYGAGNSCSSSSGSYLTPGGGISRRPVSATAGGTARRSSSSSSNDIGTASGRPSTSGSLLSSALTGAAGFSPAQHQSKGLSAAAEYMACRATVGDLLQSINSHRTAALQPPAARTTATSSLVAAMAPGGDTVFSRDGSRSGCAAVQPITAVLGSAAPGKASSYLQSGLPDNMPSVDRCTSLKAYRAFQAAGASGSSSSSNRNPPALLKAMSSVGTSTAGSSSTLEIRATAVLGKCSSNG